MVYGEEEQGESMEARQWEEVAEILASPAQKEIQDQEQIMLNQSIYHNPSEHF